MVDQAIALGPAEFAQTIYKRRLPLLRYRIPGWSTPMCRIGSRARATSGHAAAPPNTLRKLRRRIGQSPLGVRPIQTSREQLS
jgi:hypothetical protein